MTTINALLWFWSLLAGIAAIGVTYTLLIRRLAELAQPMRCAMARRGGMILRSDLPEQDKRIVRFMLSHAYSALPAFIMALVLPSKVVRLIWLQTIGRPEPVAVPNKECAAVAQMFVFSALAASPIAGLFLIIEMMTIGFVGYLVGGHVLLVRAFLATQRAEAAGPRGWFNDRAAA